MAGAERGTGHDASSLHALRCLLRDCRRHILHRRCGRRAVLVQPAAAQKRVALIVGNSAYAHAGPLTNPANDAADMAAALEEVGIEVILGLDLDKRAFDMKVRDFARALAGADTGIFFYAGHGLQVGGRNYLVPVDAQLQNERDLDFEAAKRCRSGSGRSRTKLKKKSDPQHTARLVDLAQFKERIRRIEEDNRADQQRIFETYRKYPEAIPARAPPSAGKSAPSSCRWSAATRIARNSAIRSPSSKRKWAWHRGRRRNNRHEPQLPLRPHSGPYFSMTARSVLGR